MAEESGDKKIIIDEDWKAQVKAEKEAEAQQPDEPQAGPDDEAMPDPTLSSHVMALASQAMMVMGQVPDPESGKAIVHLPYAKHVIDTIEMLETKTEGNRTPEEISLFSQALHELRMVFVSVQEQVANKSSESGISTS